MPEQPNTTNPASDYIVVSTIDKVNEGSPICVEVGRQQVVLVKFGARYFALDNTCSHAGGSLCEGFQDGDKIQCPLHASVFNMTNGQVVEGPATVPQRVYTVRLTGQNIEIAVADPEK